MKKIAQLLQELLQNKNQVNINFTAATGTKLVSISGTVREVGEDYFTLFDIYGNAMIVPTTSVAYIEVKK